MAKKLALFLMALTIFGAFLAGCSTGPDDSLVPKSDKGQPGTGKTEDLKMPSAAE